MTDLAVQEHTNIKQLFDASLTAVEAGIDHVLLVLNQSGKLELKGTPSMVLSLILNKQLFKGLI